MSKKHEVLGTSFNVPVSSNEEEILFGCGCFWGAEKAFWKLPGVITTAVGYAGGTTKSPSYNQICTGLTGHAEVVRVVWNDSIVDLSDLLKLFWECHNPTQGDRQGNDQGSQYRSAIYTNKKEHTNLAIESKIHYQKELANKGFKPITTEIKENEIFFYAEQYHQQYLAKPGSRQYCSAQPTNIPLSKFNGANFKLNKNVWNNYDWSKPHCVLRATINPIELKVENE
tara:strand:+ start:7051 stop:7731 length:681 start_codon:yes stop_codon:yes gene_type:complete